MTIAPLEDGGGNANVWAADADPINLRKAPEFCVFDRSLQLVFVSHVAVDEVDPELLELVRRLKIELDEEPELAGSSTWTPYRPGVAIRLIAVRGPGLDHLIVFFERSREMATLAAFVDKFRLSKRESEVLALLITGSDTKGIGAALSIATTTARDHIVRIMEKSHTRKRSELLVKATGGHLSTA